MRSQQVQSARPEASWELQALLDPAMAASPSLIFLLNFHSNLKKKKENLLSMPGWWKTGREAQQGLTRISPWVG